MTNKLTEVFNDPKNIKKLNKKEQYFFIKDCLTMFKYNDCEDWFIDIFKYSKVTKNKDLKDYINLYYPIYYNDLARRGIV